MRKMTLIQMTDAGFTVTEYMSGKKNHSEEKKPFFSSRGIPGHG